MVKLAYLALGSNLRSVWGTSQDTLHHAVNALQLAGCHVVAKSPSYKTPSLVRGQPDYVNLVACVATGLSASSLLRIAKAIEGQAGRRVKPKWSTRPLDIDVIMVGARCYNWPHRRHGSITLPHPEAHRRIFVLKPLCDIAPQWFHPGLGMTATQLLHRLPRDIARSIRVVERDA